MGSLRAEMNEMTSMTGPDRQMVRTLCVRIVDEENPVVFGQLLIELDALLEKMNHQQVGRTGFEGENTST